MELIDSHCHLDAEEFDSDRAQVVQRATVAGVVAQVVPAVTAASWPKLREVCRQHPCLHPAYGLHPVFVDQHQDAHLAELREWIERERPCAIGECGLDFHIEELDRERQRYVFEAQLELAAEFHLPLVIHARRAVEDVIIALKRIGNLRGVVHSFGGSPEQAQQLWQLGFHIGLGGPLTYPGANRLRRLVAAIPLEQLLLETDAPDQPDVDIRGQRNEPARLTTILHTVAQLRGQPAEEVARATSENARRLFGLPC